MMVRRLREGQKFFSYLKERKEIARQHKSENAAVGVSAIGRSESNGYV